MSSTFTGGHIVGNRESLEQKHICRVCSHVLRDPVQLVCGHRICHTCIRPSNDMVQCLECEEQTILLEIKLDKGFHKDMLPLNVHCSSCEWVGQLQNYQNHLEQSHQEYKCSYCNEIFKSLQLIEKHKEKICPKMVVNCVLQKYGCKEQVLRGDLKEHYLTEEHQRTIVFYASQLVAQVKKRYQASASDTRHTKMETSDLPSKVTTTSATTVVTQKYNDELEHFREMIELLSSGALALNEELTRLRSESLQQSLSVDTTKQVLPVIKISIEESHSNLDAMNANFSILQQELFSLKQKFEDRQAVSYDGTLIWRINKVKEKMTDAQSERQVSIYSPPFFSSPTGYKMRARLYLYGDGNARRTHMSLFFVIMKGLHDSILVFPFSFKVTFCLFDQTVQQRHIIDSFRPDTKSNSFQRPRSDMNIASGIPKFTSLTIFQQTDNPYIKDDTMFIKIMVDFENLPKTMLPYALNLNPGLPIHTQQLMIRQEIERRAQQSQLAVQINSTNDEGKLSGTENAGK